MPTNITPRDLRTSHRTVLCVNVEHMAVETLVMVANDMSRQIDSLEVMPRPMVRDFEWLCRMIERDSGRDYMIENVRAIQNW